jgi:hypothetical protein
VDTYNDPMLALQDFKAVLYDLLLIDSMMAKMSNYQPYPVTQLSVV